MLNYIPLTVAGATWYAKISAIYAVIPNTSGSKVYLGNYVWTVAETVEEVLNLVEGTN